MPAFLSTRGLLHLLEYYRTKLLDSLKNTRNNFSPSLCAGFFLSVALSFIGLGADAQCTGSGVTTPVTVIDETSTSPSSRQFVNGATTTVNTVSPGQISVEMGSASGVLAKTATYTIVSTDPPFVTINPGSTAATLTLPAANAVPGRMVTVEYIGGTANVTLQTNQTNHDTLDGATYTVTQTLSVVGQTITLVSDGGNPGNWRVTSPLFLAGTGATLTHATAGLTIAASGGSGTVTSFSAGNLSPLFTTSVATSTTTPALSFSLSNAAANTIFGNNTGSSGAPTFNTLTAGSGISITNGGGSVTIAATGGGGSGFGGNGTDSAVTNPSSVTAPKQINATTWSLSGANTYTITATPLIVNATSTFTLGDGTNASTITSTAGNGAAGGSPGVAPTSGLCPGGNGGGPGGGGGGAALSSSQATGGGGGGFGTKGGAGGYDIATTSAVNGGQAYQTWIQGGSGGGGGGGCNSANSSAAGGAGGGAIVVCAVGAINCQAVSVINCKGATGTAGTSTAGNGGGGGSGGLVFLASQTSVTVAGTVNVSGGNGGAASTTTGGGGGGGGAGRIVCWSPSNTTTSATFTLTGGTGGAKATTGTIGGTASNGTEQSITGSPNMPLFAYILKTRDGGQFLDTLTAIQIALGRCKNNIVEIDQKALAWKAGHGTLQGYCMYEFGNMTNTTCLGVGDAVKVNGQV